MCLAVPGKILERRGVDALVDLQGNRVSVSTALTPDVEAGDWVLIHAGFALTTVSEHEARETWEYLNRAHGRPEAIKEESPGHPSSSGGLA